jgi:hypothetical protein
MEGLGHGARACRTRGWPMPPTVVTPDKEQTQPENFDADELKVHGASKEASHCRRHDKAVRDPRPMHTPNDDEVDCPQYKDSGEQGCDKHHTFALADFCMTSILMLLDRRPGETNMTESTKLPNISWVQTYECTTAVCDS